MFKTKEDVIALLKTYPQLKKKINLLEYERQHPAQVSSQEVISGLALAHPISEGPGAAGHISNKTMQIALNFQEETDRLNYATVMEIDQELAILRGRIEKLEFYVAQLDKRQAEVIRKYYFEEKTWPELQKEMHASSRTLVKRRDDGLTALAAMGQYMERKNCAKHKKAWPAGHAFSSWYRLHSLRLYAPTAFSAGTACVYRY